MMNTVGDVVERERACSTTRGTAGNKGVDVLGLVEDLMGVGKDKETLRRFRGGLWHVRGCE